MHRLQCQHRSFTYSSISGKMSTLQSTQWNNSIKLSRDVTRLKEKNIVIKATLVSSNDNYWCNTSGSSIVKTNPEGKWRRRITKREKAVSLKRKNKHSCRCNAKIEDEINLCDFRLSLETKKSKIYVKNRLGLMANKTLSPK